MKRTAIVVLLFAASIFAFGQHNHSASDHHEKIQSMKIAYLTEKLQLNPQEAEKFWPVFNEYDTQRHDLERSLFRGNYVKNDSLQNMSDKDVTLLISNRLNKEQQLIDIRKEYYKKFEKVLPIKKVYLLFEAEAGFKRMLLEHIQGERSERKENAEENK